MPAIECAIRHPQSSAAATGGDARIAVASTMTLPDLPELLAKTAVSLATTSSQRVATLRLTARYLGFRGGFAYLDGWPEEWSMPRRPTSRPVARGSFAIAGNVAGFYPIDSPGGWNILGANGRRSGERASRRAT